MQGLQGLWNEDRAAQKIQAMCIVNNDIPEPRRMSNLLMYKRLPAIACGVV